MSKKHYIYLYTKYYITSLYILLYIYIPSSYLHLFWQVFETPCPTKHGMVINLVLLYILESRKGWLLQSTRFPALFSKRAPTTIHSITHSFPKSIDDDVFGDTIEWFTAHSALNEFETAFAKFQLCMDFF